VTSAGITGWEGSGAHGDAVRAARDWDIDLSGHVARMLLKEHVQAADLVLCMSGEHREATVRMAPDAGSRTFTLKELVRLLEALPPVQPQSALADASLRQRIDQAEALRRSGFRGNPHDEAVPDPLGLPAETFRAVAWELQEWCARLVDGLFGKVPVRTSMWDPDE
jgi:protein-tyrosine phosphatase